MYAHFFGVVCTILLLLPQAADSLVKGRGAISSKSKKTAKKGLPGAKSNGMMTAKTLRNMNTPEKNIKEGTLDDIERLFLSPNGLQEFENNKKEAKEWYKKNLWETTLTYAGGLDSDQVDYDAFFEGFTRAFFGNFSASIDLDLIGLRIEDALANQTSRALSVDSFQYVLPHRTLAKTMLRGLEKLSEFDCWFHVGALFVDIVVLIVTAFTKLPKGPTATIIKAGLKADKVVPAVIALLKSSLPLKSDLMKFVWKIIPGLFGVFLTAFEMKEMLKKFWDLKWEIGTAVLVGALPRIAALWLTAGSSLVIELLSVSASLFSIVGAFMEIFDGKDGCMSYWSPQPAPEPEEPVGPDDPDPKPDDPECDTSDPCRILVEVFNGVCIYKEKSCPPFTSCDKRDGLCKENNEIISCVAVIDEDDSFSDGGFTQAALWEQFRDEYPYRPFCLLIPGPESGVAIPQAMRNNPYTIIKSDVVKDWGEEAQAADWTGLCGLQDYDGKSNKVGFVGLFVDDSGSMSQSEVMASYYKFIQDMADRSIVVKEVVNSEENWILPFIDTLVPPKDCVTRSGEKGTCIGVARCNGQGGKYVPWVATDPEPNCRSFPTDVHCCVLPPECMTRNGEIGTCIDVTKCNELGKVSVPWAANDPEPNCRSLPNNVQCCVPPPECMTRNYDIGRCIDVTKCDEMGQTSVPWAANDPEPNCRSFPTNVQCCVPPPECTTPNGTWGKCMAVTQCNAEEGISVPWAANDPEPNCRWLPTNVQCCVPKIII